MIEGMVRFCYTDIILYYFISVIGFGMFKTGYFPRMTVDLPWSEVFMMTRGTRGDVQPFVALARGLAEELGWLATWQVTTVFRWEASAWFRKKRYQTCGVPMVWPGVYILFMYTYI